ncbi:CubicO group peptidase, beta-lactamase class C family [Acinetobacter marinus]|uniref:CubicO group peptidase, beta-lactamase class C family n=1 Tax=Acinetobacter marinus TaxID=281375 RepID=A0A1G6GYT7_9GAMM|nr:serine hydrolase domain-containing protein [Acinetobacter marinus]SDB87043.1 CubicO group peptidase, beta-lactamase class C family [Acinetobacter marinus]
MKFWSTNTSPIADDLVTDIGNESPIALTGMSEAQKQKIWSAIEQLYRTGNHPQISFCLRRQGQIVLNRSIGFATGNGPDDLAFSAKRLAKTTTPICLFSASKLVTAMLVHLLDQEGALNLLDPISHYIPEYAKHGKRHTTIFHLLSHRGGIPKVEGKIAPETLFDKAQILQLLYDAKPMSVSGSKLAYHAVTAGYILGEVMERVTQMPLTQLLHERISEPMGMRCFNYGLAPEFRDEVAKNYATGFFSRMGTDQYLRHVLGADLQTTVDLTNDARFMDTISPAANIYTSAEEMGRFFEMLLNGGQYQDRQIFSPETVFRATLPTSGYLMDRSLMIPMRYALGPMLGGDPVGIFGPMTGQAFGHIGFSNIMCWADPKRDISVSLLSTGKSIVGTHIPPLLNVLYQISTQCPSLERQRRRGVFASDQQQAEKI